MKDIIREQSVDADTLRGWLEHGEPVFVLDVRDASQREEWQIPGSRHLNAYKRLSEGDYTVMDEIQVPDNTKVVTVCTAGRTSKIAAALLRQRGIDAYSLDGGMRKWSLAWNTAIKKFNEFEVLQVRRTGKGCLSYIVSSNKEAIVIDASLPLEVYQQLLNEYGLTIKYVLETHIHADHLSRAKTVAEFYNVPLFLPIPNKVHFEHQAAKVDTVFTIGDIQMQTMITPGHTFESVSYYVGTEAIFTGDTLFVDGVGRPDLKADDTNETRNRAALLYESIQRIVSLKGEMFIFPGHTSQPIPFDDKIIASTIDEVKKRVKLLNVPQHEFVDTLVQKIPAPPPNYLAIVEKNLSGDVLGADASELEAGANRCAVS